MRKVPIPTFTFRQGTTPSFTFQLQYDVDMFSNVKVTFWQDDVVVLEKKRCDCEVVDGLLTLTLSQAETFLFKCNNPAKVQLRAVTPYGEAATSDEYIGYVARCLDKEVLK